MVKHGNLSAQRLFVGALIGKLAAIFAILAIFISCLGLFGLAAYMAEQRTREIGIRKVLGATVAQVLVLLSRDFILLVGISCIIASPLAFLLVNRAATSVAYEEHAEVSSGDRSLKDVNKLSPCVSSQNTKKE